MSTTDLVKEKKDGEDAASLKAYESKSIYGDEYYD